MHSYWFRFVLFAYSSFSWLSPFSKQRAAKFVQYKTCKNIMTCRVTWHYYRLRWFVGHRINCEHLQKVTSNTMTKKNWNITNRMLRGPRVSIFDTIFMFFCLLFWVLKMTKLFLQKLIWKKSMIFLNVKMRNSLWIEWIGRRMQKWVNELYRQVRGNFTCRPTLMRVHESISKAFQTQLKRLSKTLLDMINIESIFANFVIWYVI